jgi:hypothetical protein
MSASGSSLVSLGQQGGGGMVQQPDEAASFRSHKGGRQLPVDFLPRLEDGFDDAGLTFAAGQEQYHSRLIDHT